MSAFGGRADVSHGVFYEHTPLAVFDAEAADAARLEQSILKAAFASRLVPQDAADEPASALLARIAANPIAPRAGRGRTKPRVTRIAKP
jgi:type I restriction enzyme, S subunit